LLPAFFPSHHLPSLICNSLQSLLLVVWLGDCNGCNSLNNLLPLVWLGSCIGNT
jgi:hypothetical protein